VDWIFTTKNTSGLGTDMGHLHAPAVQQALLCPTKAMRPSAEFQNRMTLSRWTWLCKNIDSCLAHQSRSLVPMASM